MDIKHSKYKNTGILFELLVHQITQDTLRGKNSPAISLIKRYFTKSELGREYKLYDSLLKSNTLNESRANMLVSAVLENSKKLNRSSIRRQKYNLIKEIKDTYNIESFFNVKINNYKIFASIFTLIEGHNSIKTINPNQIVNNQITLLEFLTKKEIIVEGKEKDILDEFETYDKDLKLLTYMVLLEKFNEKYNGFSTEQKMILREFINLGDSQYSLKNFYNEKIIELKEILMSEIVKIKDTVIKIKCKEIVNFLTELDKKVKVNNDHLVDLLQYYDLIQEIKKVHIISKNG